MKIKTLENNLLSALTEANKIQKEKSSREMSMIITSLENAQDKLWRLQKQLSK
ncbi:hypothetical protein [uncultured Tenacibaculum sp.]|uniref:hypothetical protein n=1 Tax=uncultured Tenacibaculum sp. TaxID=174713 RepID=UPI002604D0ED|nr:hypothetical protein [uncultured Tenacibaculum sp.]